MTGDAFARVSHVRLKLPVPWVSAGHRLTHRDYSVLRLRDREGITGHGIVAGRVDRRGVRRLAGMALALGPLTLGEASERLGWDGTPGVRTIVDLALWDLRARQAGLPVHRLLNGDGCGGGAVRGGGRSLPAYASGGGYPPEGDPAEAAAAEAAGWASEGWTTIKIKVAGLPPRQDRRRIEAVRAAAPDLAILVDANAGWTTPDQALEFLDAVGSSVGWIEEPFPPGSPDAYGRLAAETDVPLAAGEQARTLGQLRRLVDVGGVRVLQPDATVLDGGATAWLEAAELALGRGVAVAPHHWPELHAHLMAAAPAATTLEYVRPDTIVNYQRLLRPPCLPYRGSIVPVAEPGWGFEVDGAAVTEAAA